MHIIIKEFINTDKNIKAILEEHHDKNQPVEVVFAKLCNFNNSDFNQKLVFLEMDRAIIIGHPDSNVYYYFISMGIRASIYVGNIVKAKVLHEIIKSLVNEKVPIELQAYFLQSLAQIYEAENKIDECYNLYSESLKLIKRSCKRFYNFYLIASFLYANQGRLNEFENDIFKEGFYSDNDTFNMIYSEIKLRNAIVTGKQKDNIELFKICSKATVENTDFMLCKESMIKILSGDFKEKNYAIDFYRHFANACSNLIEGNFKKAQEFVILMDKEVTNNNVHTLKLNKYFHLHCELGMGNIGKANLLYQHLRQFGYHGYLGDFFLGRIQLLEMKSDEAYETFRRLIYNIKRYDAMGRLLFELQFAKELSSTFFVWFLAEINENKAFDESKLLVKEVVSIHKKENGLKALIGDSQLIHQVKSLVKKFANLQAPVLITGETGTGKELVSRAIHDEGPNSKEPFLSINCGALSESLLQSELFGYVAGAFTGAQKERKGIFEAAGKGTVFLDEFGDISPKLQVSLLRVLEANEIRLIGGTSTRQIECKIVIATNSDLRQAVEEKNFREDLYFRITRFEINLPPLRERIEDIESLILHFLIDPTKPNEQQKQVSKRLLNTLIGYLWPGNIRELKNEIERLKILHPDKLLLDIEDFDFKRLQGFVPKSSIKSKKAQEKKSLNITHPQQVLDERVKEIALVGSRISQRHELIKELFRQYKSLTKMQILKIMKISHVTLANDLKILCNTKFIERKMPTKSFNSHYFVWVE